MKKNQHVVIKQDDDDDDVLLCGCKGAQTAAAPGN